MGITLVLSGCATFHLTQEPFQPKGKKHGGSNLFFKNYPVTQIVAQLFESPGGKEVGRSQYAVRVDDQTHQVLSDDVRRVALELAEKTHTLK